MFYTVFYVVVPERELTGIRFELGTSGTRVTHVSWVDQLSIGNACAAVRLHDTFLVFSII